MRDLLYALCAAASTKGVIRTHQNEPLIVKA